LTFAVSCAGAGAASERHATPAQSAFAAAPNGALGRGRSALRLDARVNIGMLLAPEVKITSVCGPLGRDQRRPRVRGATGYPLIPADAESSLCRAAPSLGPRLRGDERFGAGRRARHGKRQEWSSLPCLIEIFQVGDRLILLGGH